MFYPCLWTDADTQSVVASMKPTSQTLNHSHYLSQRMYYFICASLSKIRGTLKIALFDCYHYHGHLKHQTAAFLVGMVVQLVVILLLFFLLASVALSAAETVIYNVTFAGTDPQGNLSLLIAVHSCVASLPEQVF